MRITQALLGATRGVMTGKRGNKNFYKGTGSGKMGEWTKRGNYILKSWRIRDYVVPEELADTKLTPYVSPEVTKRSRLQHSAADYFTRENILAALAARDAEARGDTRPPSVAALDPDRRARLDLQADRWHRTAMELCARMRGRSAGAGGGPGGQPVAT